MDFVYPDAAIAGVPVKSVTQTLVGAVVTAAVILIRRTRSTVWRTPKSSRRKT